MFKVQIQIYDFCSFFTFNIIFGIDGTNVADCKLFKLINCNWLLLLFMLLILNVPLNNGKLILYICWFCLIFNNWFWFWFNKTFKFANGHNWWNFGINELLPIVPICKCYWFCWLLLFWFLIIWPFCVKKLIFGNGRCIFGTLKLFDCNIEGAAATTVFGDDALEFVNE